MTASLIDLQPAFSYLSQYHRQPLLARRKLHKLLVRAVNTGEIPSNGLELGRPMKLDRYNLMVIEHYLRRKSTMRIASVDVSSA